MSIQQAIKEALTDKTKVVYTVCKHSVNVYTGSKDLSDTIVIHSKD